MHASYCTPNEEPVAGEVTGSRGQIATTIFLNQHRFQLVQFLLCIKEACFCSLEATTQVPMGCLAPNGVPTQPLCSRLRGYHEKGGGGAEEMGQH